jgi:hypothetical protein
MEARQTFLPLNQRFGTACTDWQIRPARGEPMAFNDHTDWRWDGRALQGRSRPWGVLQAPVRPALRVPGTL